MARCCKNANAVYSVTKHPTRPTQVSLFDDRIEERIMHGPYPRGFMPLVVRTSYESSDEHYKRILEDIQKGKYESL